ncbi:MAG: hypothetical protein AMJ43_03730 [Coxiella sp. DG_40]|nr:MAG: hypothetical protein AMJ43_03730 [Coxiella sp. DG_40]
MNKKLLILILSTIILTLSACASILDKLATTERPSKQHTICAQLKRELIFYNTDLNLNPQWSSPTKRAQLLQEYKKYQCDQLQ